MCIIGATHDHLLKGSQLNCDYPSLETLIQLNYNVDFMFYDAKYNQIKTMLEFKHKVL
jgi:hypothetical protein